jgi:hypothetical protein
VRGAGTSSPPASRSSGVDCCATVEIPEVTRLATTIDRRRDEVLAYFRTGRASSGPVEAVNGESEQVDRAARGFRNIHHYRTRMLLKTAVDGTLPRTPPPRRTSAGRLDHPRVEVRQCCFQVDPRSAPPR